MDVQIKHNERIVLRGLFHIEGMRGGKRVLLSDEENLIVLDGREQLAHLLGGDGLNRQVNRIGFGIGSTAAAPGNTALTSPYIKNIGSVTYPVAARVQFNWSLSTAECNGVDICEFGLICANGKLFSRKVRGRIEKDDDLSLTGAWTIIF